MIGGAPEGGNFPGPLVALALTVGGVVAATFATVFVIGLSGTEPTVASMGIGEAIGLGAIASFAARRVAQPHRERFGLYGFRLSSLPILVMLLPIVILLSEVDNLLLVMLSPAELPAPPLDAAQALAGPGFLTTIETVIVAVGIAPVVEEWFFRGVIQQGLVAQLSRARGVVVTAALFAIVHLGPAPVGQAALSPFFSSFALGLALGAVRLATGSLLACILVSAGTSALGLAAVSLADSFPIPGFNAPGSHTPIEILLPALFAVAWSGSLILRAARAAPVTIPIPRSGAGGLYPSETDEG